MLPKKILPWDSFFEAVNQYKFDDQQKHKRPKFLKGYTAYDESDLRLIFGMNFCLVLNEVMDDYEFSGRPTHTPGKPDFTCYHAESKLILLIEARMRHVLENFDEETFSVINQIYSYMTENQLKYSIITTYEKHLFLCRPTPTELWISKPLSTSPQSSSDPPALKALAYIALLASDDYFTLHPLILKEPASAERNMISGSSFFDENSSNNPNSNKQSSFSNSVRNQPKQQNLSFKDFKFKKILGNGRSGKTLLCEFCGKEIALKSTDLHKAKPCILKEMQSEVEIYKILADIQGEYIPKLECYGYYGGGMCYVIGTTLVGITLSDYKSITDQQRNNALQSLRAIHDRGVLHNDIKSENILLGNNGYDVYLIDFGLSIHFDAKEKSEFKEFKKEELELSKLLDKYTVS